ncbi:ATP-binding protein [Streptomyces physcomitrii]|uniref:AAA family ATPase n=1 Tax=Streptomyces physcomitrii TaxID=2724184 RepID=A0ABX1HAJ3_9ACTN|nr:AAA family ATPase [Streptomyces physcomitrii]NKI45067.1 AAA family ATPase [Streptomyces physcomitrii]
MTVVTGERSPHGSGKTGAPPELVERERELSVLTEAARRAAAGSPGLIVLEGPDGIGKSALLRALVDAAPALRVLTARAEPEQRQTPLSLARRLVAPLAEAHRADPALPWPVHPEKSADHAVRGRSDIDVNAVPHGLLAELYELLRSAATHGPLLLAVDDAHLADPASLHFLAHTARRLPGQPVLLALSCRGGHASASLDEIAAQPQCRTLRPRPLTAEGIGRVARALTGSAGDAQFQGSCLAVTGGNPLLVTRLVSALRENGLDLTVENITAVDGQGAQSFRSRIAHLLSQQPDSVLRAVRAMAVLGDGTPTDLCGRLATLDEPAFAQSLFTLNSLGLVGFTAGAGAWSFTHPVVREAVLDGLGEHEGGVAHGRAARLLHDSGAPTAEVIVQLLRSRGTPTEPWATTLLREAAREAMLASRPERAVELLRPCVPEGRENDCSPALLTELGVAEGRVDPEAAVGHLTVALKRAIDPELRLTALSALAVGLARTGQLARAVGLLNRHRTTGAEDGVASAQLLEAQLLMAVIGSREAYLELIETVPLDLDLPGETPAERVLVATRAVLVASRMDRVPECLAATRRAWQRSSPTTDSYAFLATAATSLLYTDAPREAEDVFRQLIHGGETLPEDECRNALGLSADACLRLGSLEAALKSATRALKDTDLAAVSHHQALALAIRLHVFLEQGDLDAASAAVAGSPDPKDEDAWQWNELLGAHGRLRLAQGDAEGALALLTECGRRQRAWQRTNPAVSPWWYWAGRAHLALGQYAEARELADEAIGLARAGRLPCALGTGLELRAAAVRDPRERAALLEEAESVLAPTGAELILARVRVSRGRALYELGQKEAAREVLRKGWNASYAAGARALHEEARKALLATGARPRRPVSSGLGSLTRSQSQVARLAAEGASNAEIAETLFVTQRTVEVHLTSAYRKLGVSGRRELRGALRPPEEGTRPKPGRPA